MRLFVILLFFIGSSAFAQKSEKEVWYIWIDAEVTIDGQTVRAVSDELIEITCCVKSGKYRRFTEKTTKWLESELNASLNSETSLKKLQDKALAEQMIKDANSKAQSDPGIRVVHYEGSCK